MRKNRARYDSDEDSYIPSDEEEIVRSSKNKKKPRSVISASNSVAPRPIKERKKRKNHPAIQDDGDDLELEVVQNMENIIGNKKQQTTHPDEDNVKRWCIEPGRHSVASLRQLANSKNVAVRSDASKEVLCRDIAQKIQIDPVPVEDVEMVEIPREFQDPFAWSLLVNPVISASGDSYNESTHLESFLKGVNDKQQMPFKNWYIRDRNLRQAVENWAIEHGIDIVQKQQEEMDYVTRMKTALRAKYEKDMTAQRIREQQIQDARPQGIPSMLDRIMNFLVGSD